MRGFLLHLSALAMLLGAGNAAQAVPIIDNGSFETPVVASGGFSNFNVGTSFQGWSVVGNPNTHVSIVSGAFNQGGVAFGAQDGAQWLDLTGNGSNTVEGVAQTVTTTIGNLYSLTFYIGNTTAAGFGTTSTVRVLIDNVLLSADVNPTVSATSLNWMQFTHQFMASGASTTLAFINGDPGSDNSNGLDNIVLTDLGPAAAAAIPEPGSLPILAAALLWLGFLARRRVKQSA